MDDSKPWGVNNISISQTNLPVEPPPPSVGRGAGAAVGRLVIVPATWSFLVTHTCSHVSRVSPVDGGELEPVVSGQGVAGVARVAAHPQPVVLGLPVQPGHSGQ